MHVCVRVHVLLGTKPRALCMLSKRIALGPNPLLTTSGQAFHSVHFQTGPQFPETAAGPIPSHHHTGTLGPAPEKLPL